MASGSTSVSDIIVPELFTPYVQNLTTTKSNILSSGIMVRDPELDGFLASGGLTFHAPSFKDLDDDAERSSTDTMSDDFSGGTISPTPNKIGSLQEICVRLSRNQSWSAADLSAALAGADPMAAIGALVGSYWRRRLQTAVLAVMKGVFADNTANDSADYTVDISGSSFVDGVTNFSAEAMIDAFTLLGDSAEELVAICIHSIVYARMQKNNLIDFIPDSDGKVNIPTFLGRRVIIDDGMPKTGNVYESWLFGPGVLRFGQGSPKVPTAVERKEGAGNGGGQEVLYNRVEWIIHPKGHAYIGTAPIGGPTNAATSNNLAAAGSWNRVFPERKQIKVARLITREA